MWDYSPNLKKKKKKFPGEGKINSSNEQQGSPQLLEVCALNAATQTPCLTPR